MSDSHPPSIPPADHANGPKYDYISFLDIPPEIYQASEALFVYFEKKGMREWQFSHVADRRLVNNLERQLEELRAQKPEKTPIELAALRLAEFLRRNCPPDDAIGTQDHEWPVSIVVDNEQDAEQLGQLLTDLETELKKGGCMDQAAQTKAFDNVQAHP